MGRRPFEIEPRQEPYRLPTAEENIAATRLAVDSIVNRLAELERRLVFIENSLASIGGDVRDVKRKVGSIQVFGPSGRSIAAMVETIFNKIGGYR